MVSTAAPSVNLTTRRFVSRLASNYRTFDRQVGCSPGPACCFRWSCPVAHNDDGCNGTNATGLEVCGPLRDPVPSRPSCSLLARASSPLRSMPPDPLRQLGIWVFLVAAINHFFRRHTPPVECDAGLQRSARPQCDTAASRRSYARHRAELRPLREDMPLCVGCRLKFSVFMVSYPEQEQVYHSRRPHRAL